MASSSTVERAFELARGGQCRSVDDIRRKLQAERCEAVEGHLSSGALKRQLLELIQQAVKE
jgi:hypothetical protein